MPRTEGVSSSSRMLRILLRPRPTSVSFWPGLRPSADAVWVTRTLGIRLLLDRRLAGCLRPGRVAAAKDFGDLLAAASRDRTRAGTILQSVERRLDHVVRVA